jgi:hemolysin III
MNSSSVPNKTYSELEEWLHALSHGAGCLAAVFGLFLLLNRVDDLFNQVVVIVYGLSMILMFLSSTLYHGVSNVNIKAYLKVLDHSAIYLLIAGTYTPLMLISVGGMTGTVAMLLIWSIALIGIVFKIFANNRFPRLSLWTYLLMGWMAVFFAYPLYQNLSVEGLWLLLAGGLCYTIGVGFYVAKHLPFTHAIWHVFVAAGCACHYMVIYQYVV